MVQSALAKFNNHSIEWKELFAIVVACQIWGSRWQRKRIIFHCDNQAIVRIWQSGLSRSGLLMQLVRQLFLLAASNNFTVIIRHVPGVQNCIADSLSRFQMDRFRSLAPDALPLPVTTPAIPTFTSELD